MSQARQKPATPAKKLKLVASHPTYREMILEAINELAQGSGGSSRQAIVKYVVVTYAIEEKVANQHTKAVLKVGVKQDWLKQVKGVGASGSFRVGEAAKPAASKEVVMKKAATAPKPATAAKPKAPKTPKKKKKKANKRRWRFDPALVAANAALAEEIAAADRARAIRRAPRK
jgi:histone H1/5